ncbi:MAG: PhnD/SsuA/transferrin family substrate-binding protein [Deltaproteobacteria bacterium]|nr:PhnD/SsuA/transferrin family substrate-binding protein [Deltaproteobacteria bacterium]
MNSARLSFIELWAVIVALFCASPVPASSSSIDLLLLLPGYPGTSAQAQPYVDRMLRHLEQGLGLAPQSMQGVFISDGSEGAQRLESEKPGIALVGPSVYAKYAKKMKMKVIAKVDANGRGEQTYHVVVAKNGPAAIALLKGIVTGAVVHDDKYVVNVLFDRKVKASELTFVSNSRPLRALRDVAAGKADAVIVDDETLKYMKDLPFAADLREIYTTRPVPAPAVVVLNQGMKYVPQLKKLLVGLCLNSEGEALCQSLTISAITPATDEDYQPLLRDYNR